jgi:hypothetical protein
MYLVIQFNHCAKKKPANFGTSANVPLDPQHYFEIVIRSKTILSILSKLLINN